MATGVEVPWSAAEDVGDVTGIAGFAGAGAVVPEPTGASVAAEATFVAPSTSKTNMAPTRDSKHLPRFVIPPLPKETEPRKSHPQD